MQQKINSRCEVFNMRRCFGCVGLDPQYDIDKLKLQCEIYKEEMGIGIKQIEMGE